MLDFEYTKVRFDYMLRGPNTGINIRVLRVREPREG